VKLDAIVAGVKGWRGFTFLSFGAIAARPGMPPRPRFVEGTAERRPAADARHDLVVRAASFGHWADQAAGMAECARCSRQ